MRTIILLGFSFFFTSCMHVGMMGTGTDHQSNFESVLEKEITVGDTRATAIFPPLETGKETLFTLKLVDKRTGHTISGAKVSFHAEYLHSNNEHKMHGTHMKHSKADSTMSHRMEQEYNMSHDLKVNENTADETYSLRFKPSQPGEHRLAFHVSAIGDMTLNPVLVIESTRVVMNKDDSHSAGMHGLSSWGTYGIIAGITMGAMMVWLWASGGRMF